MGGKCGSVTISSNLMSKNTRMHYYFKMPHTPLQFNRDFLAQSVTHVPDLTAV